MNPDDFRRLVAAGLNTEQIAIVMEMMDRDARAYAAAEEVRKAKSRDRVQRWREARNVTETSPKVTERLTGEGDAPVDDKTSNTAIEPLEENKPARGDAGEFRDALRAVLDPERLEALVKHRRSRKAPVTAFAAKLFLRDITVCGISVAEAADHCISRNWLTVKPEWLAKVAPRSPPASAPSMADVFEFAARTRPDERPAEDFGSARAALPHLSVAGKG